MENEYKRAIEDFKTLKTYVDSEVEMSIYMAKTNAARGEYAAALKNQCRSECMKELSLLIDQFISDVEVH